MSNPLYETFEDPPVSDDEEGRDLDLRLYVDILRRRWSWVMGFGLIAVASAWLFSTTRESYPVYTAEALVQRLQQPSGVAAQFLGSQGRSNPINSELEILRTDVVLGGAVRSSGLRLELLDRPDLRTTLFGRIEVSPEAAEREYLLRRMGTDITLFSAEQEIASANPDGILVSPGLVIELQDRRQVPLEGIRLAVMSTRDAIRKIDRDLRAQQVSGTDLIRITFSARDPAFAAAVVNAVALAYQEHVAARAKQEAERRREWIAARLESVADSLRIAQDMVLEFQAQSQTLDPSSEGATLPRMLADAEADVRNAEDRERLLSEVLETLREGTRNALRQTVIFQGSLVPGWQGLYDRLQTYEDRRSELITVQRRTVTSPEVQLLDSLIAETKSVMVQTAEEALRLARESRQRSASRVAELRSQFGDVSERNLTFARLQQRVSRIQNMHNLLAGALYEAQVSEAVEAGDVQIIDPATVPTAPSSVIGSGLNPLLALVFGLLLGSVVAIGYEQFDSRIRRPEEARTATGSPIIGLIPAISAAKAGEIVVGVNGNVESEAFRMLRTNLRFARVERVRSLAVTSAAPGDGKSLIASNLAISLVQEGKRTLLVDCDLRRPVLHTIFEQPRSPGLTDLLIGESTTECVRHLPEQLHLITAGTAVPNPAELLGSPAFHRFLERQQEDYDVVVVDTPPVLVVSDLSVIASAVDGVLLVARQEQTHREALASAAAQVRRARGTILGVAVNGISPTKTPGYYGYGYYATADRSDDQSGNSRSARRGRRV